MDQNSLSVDILSKSTREADCRSDFLSITFEHFVAISCFKNYRTKINNNNDKNNIIDLKSHKKVQKTDEKLEKTAE